MVYVKIYHTPIHLFGRLNKIAEISSIFNDYVHVATVPLEAAKFTHVNQILENAFRATNSYDHNWFESDDVILAEPGTGHRSSSVGDVFEIDGEYFIVDSVGFVSFQPKDMRDGIIEEESGLFQDANTEVAISINMNQSDWESPLIDPSSGSYIKI